MPKPASGPPPEGFRQLAEKYTNREIGVMLKRGQPTIINWLKLVGMSGRRNHKRRRAVPVDFRAVGPTLTTNGGATHWETDRRTVQRWHTECGTEAAQPVKPVWIPADWADQCHRPSPELIEHYGVAGSTILAYHSRAGTKPPPKRMPVRVAVKKNNVAPIRSVPRSLASPVPSIDPTVEAHAAHFLMKDFRQVCKTETIGRPPGGWLVGNKIYTTEAMMDLAYDHGFDARAWARVA